MSDTESLLAGRYQLAGLLGVGGMAEVHRAWDTRLGRSVAVKLFHPGIDFTARLRFENEIRTLAALSHPGLVSVYDAGQSGQASFVVLQLVEGRTLRDRILDGPLRLDETRRLGVRLADALAHVHARGVVHRDVKPSNILLDAEGAAYLADFGLARLSGSTRHTRADEVVGTAAYLAPEQVRGEEVTASADVYALGLVLLECLTGRREYTGGEVEAAVARLHRAPAVPDDLPDDLARLLSLMTALPSYRRPSAEECARVLRGGVGGALPPPPPEHDSTPTQEMAVPAPHRRGHVKLLAASAVVLGLSAFTWVISSGADPSAPAGPPPPAATSVEVTSSPEQVVHTVTVEVPVSEGTQAPSGGSPLVVAPGDTSRPHREAKAEPTSQEKRKAGR